MESLSIWKSSWWLHYQAVSGEGGSSPGPGWCYPWDQDTEESPSVTTTLFALYLRILLYNKFDVAKPSDHITTIKLIPLSYSGGPTQCHDGQTISWPKLRINLALPAFFSPILLTPANVFVFHWPDQSLLIFTTPGSMALFTAQHLWTQDIRRHLLVWFSTIKQ